MVSAAHLNQLKMKKESPSFRCFSSTSPSDLINIMAINQYPRDPYLPTISLELHKNPLTMTAPPDARMLEVANILSSGLTHREKAQNKWDSRFEQLKEYAAKHSDCNVPREYLEDPAFGTWVATQRVMHKKYLEGDKNEYTAARIAKLNSIGFQWMRQKRTVEAVIKPWDERLEDLKAYKRRFWHCDVPRDWVDDPSLALWVRNQRGHYKKWKNGQKSNMTEERVRNLEEIGFTWSIKKTPVRKQWEERVNELNSYRITHGDCNVPRRWKKDETLGRWVRQQRYDYDSWRFGKKTSLNEERVAILNNIGFSWRLKKVKSIKRK